MEVDKKELQDRYSNLDTDELIEMETAGNLTEEALQIVREELSSRGLEPPAQSVDSSKVCQPTEPAAEAELPVRFYRGEIALWKTFWFGMFLPGSILSSFVRSEVIGSFFAVFILGVLAIGVFRSAFKYRGPRGWAVAAVLYTFFYIILPFNLN